MVQDINSVTYNVFKLCASKSIYKQDHTNITTAKEILLILCVKQEIRITKTRTIIPPTLSALMYLKQVIYA